MEFLIKVGIIALGAMIGVLVATKVQIFASDNGIKSLDNYTPIGG